MGFNFHFPRHHSSVSLLFSASSSFFLTCLSLPFSARTPFHADVFRSYSWSANICGKKKWLVFPPGQEEFLKDRHGHLPFDITAPDLKNGSLYPRYAQSSPPVEIIQEAGEIVFIPSGWHHQVYNLVRIFRKPQALEPPPPPTPPLWILLLLPTSFGSVHFPSRATERKTSPLSSQALVCTSKILGVRSSDEALNNWWLLRLGCTWFDLP